MTVLYRNFIKHSKLYIGIFSMFLAFAIGWSYSSESEAAGYWTDTYQWGNQLLTEGTEIYSLGAYAYNNVYSGERGSQHVPEGPGYYISKNSNDKHCFYFNGTDWYMHIRGAHQIGWFKVKELIGNPPHSHNYTAVLTGEDQTTSTCVTHGVKYKHYHWSCSCGDSYDTTERQVLPLDPNNHQGPINSKDEIIQNGYVHHYWAHCEACGANMNDVYKHKLVAHSGLSGSGWYNASDSFTISGTVNAGYQLTGFQHTGGISLSSSTGNGAGSNGSATTVSTRVTMGSGGGASVNGGDVAFTVKSNSYAIKYNANTPSVASHSVTNMPSGQSVTCHTSNSNATNNWSTNTFGSAPSLTGWTFLGWSTNPNATTATYAAGSTFSGSLWTKDGATVTLYAVWQANTYTVHLDADEADVNNGHADIVCLYDHDYKMWTINTTSTSTTNALRRSGYWFKNLNAEIKGTLAKGYDQTGTYYSTSTFRNLSPVNGDTVNVTVTWSPISNRDYDGSVDDSTPDSNELPSSTTDLPDSSGICSLTYLGNGATTSSGETSIVQSVESSLSTVTMLDNTFGTEASEDGYIDYSDTQDSSVSGNTTASRFYVPEGTWTYTTNTGITAAFKGWSIFADARSNDTNYSGLVQLPGANIAYTDLIYMKRALVDTGLANGTWTLNHISALETAFNLNKSTVSAYYNARNVSVYAEWDEYPTISVENAYVYASNITNSDTEVCTSVTPQALLRLLSVEDHEDGSFDLSDANVSGTDSGTYTITKTVDNGVLTIQLLDYSYNDFKNAAKSTSSENTVAITVRVIDSSGNTTYKTFNVTIANDNQETADTTTDGDVTRFISFDTTDTLMNDSIWSINEDYKSLLDATFNKLSTLISYVPTKLKNSFWGNSLSELYSNDKVNYDVIGSNDLSDSEQTTSTWVYDYDSITQYSTAYEIDLSTINTLTTTTEARSVSCRFSITTADSS